MTSINPIQASPLKLIPADDPRLLQKAEPLSLKELRSNKVQALIQEMLAIANFEGDPEKMKEQGRMVGLAGPQVGWMKQVIVVDTTTNHREENQFEVLINPVITWESAETEPLIQGCYSVPDCYKGLVERPKEVRVQALSPDGTQVEKLYAGYASHVVQHEIDHLNGIRFPERISKLEELHLLPNGNADLPKYRKKWTNWKIHPSQETFEHLQKGYYESPDN